MNSKDLREIESVLTDLEEVLVAKGAVRAPKYGYDDSYDSLRRDAADEADEANGDEEDDDYEQDIYDAPAYEAVDDGDEHPNHPFVILARKIASENDGVSPEKSYQLARARRPDLFRSYQRFSREGEVGKSYHQLVDAEIRKGCSPVVAAQRVTYEGAVHSINSGHCAYSITSSARASSEGGTVSPSIRAV